jgi:hypothetical protein
MLIPLSDLSVGGVCLLNCQYTSTIMADLETYNHNNHTHTYGIVIDEDAYGSSSFSQIDLFFCPSTLESAFGIALPPASVYQKGYLV